MDSSTLSSVEIFEGNDYLTKLIYVNNVNLLKPKDSLHNGTPYGLHN